MTFLFSRDANEFYLAEQNNPKVTYRFVALQDINQVCI